jgi:hypothetical protein
LLEAAPANAQMMLCMMQNSDKSSNDPVTDRPRAVRLMPGLIIVAIVVLIVIAVVSFN